MSTPPKPPAHAETHRALGVGLFNCAWELMETADRTPEQDDELSTPPTPRDTTGCSPGSCPARPREWQCARVYSTLGRGEPALWHARRCLAILEANGGGLTTGTSQPPMRPSPERARSPATLPARDEWSAKARAALAGIADPDDRGVIEQDLATLP